MLTESRNNILTFSKWCSRMHHIKYHSRKHRYFLWIQEGVYIKTLYASLTNQLNKYKYSKEFCISMYTHVYLYMLEYVLNVFICIMEYENYFSPMSIAATPFHVSHALNNKYNNCLHENYTQRTTYVN